MSSEEYAEILSAATHVALRVSARNCSHPSARPTNEEQGNRSDRDPLRLEAWILREWTRQGRYLEVAEHVAGMLDYRRRQK